MTGRSVKEWCGRTPDSVPPPHVVARIFDAWKGECHITHVKIEIGDDWDVDHIKRLADGGENRESNMAPALRDAHQRKTAEETQRGRKADRIRRRHIGARPKSKTPIQSPAKPEKKKREQMPMLPPRKLYVRIK
jgi:5-methylcytosine-specific restriction protein A